jgi:hypothetical protein
MPDPEAVTHNRHMVLGRLIRLITGHPEFRSMTIEAKELPEGWTGAPRVTVQAWGEQRGTPSRVPCHAGTLDPESLANAYRLLERESTERHLSDTLTPPSPLPGGDAAQP